jgi:hypothetical protein
MLGKLSGHLKDIGVKDRSALLIYFSISSDLSMLKGYDYFRAMGLPIGSGEVESAHRYIPQKRLKIPGATWHPDTINPMLACAYYSG